MDLAWTQYSFDLLAGYGVYRATAFVRSRITHHLPYGEDAAMTLGMVKNARMSRAYIIERLFQHRVAAMRDIKGEEE